MKRLLVLLAFACSPAAPVAEPLPPGLDSDCLGLGVAMADYETRCRPEPNWRASFDTAVWVCRGAHHTRDFGELWGYCLPELATVSCDAPTPLACEGQIVSDK